MSTTSTTKAVPSGLLMRYLRHDTSLADRSLLGLDGHEWKFHAAIVFPQAPGLAKIFEEAVGSCQGYASDIHTQGKTCVGIAAAPGDIDTLLDVFYDTGIHIDTDEWIDYSWNTTTDTDVLAQATTLREPIASLIGIQPLLHNLYLLKLGELLGADEMVDQYLRRLRAELTYANNPMNGYPLPGYHHVIRYAFKATENAEVCKLVMGPLVRITSARLADDPAYKFVLDNPETPSVLLDLKIIFIESRVQCGGLAGHVG